MKFYIDDEEVSLSEADLDYMYLDEGTEADAYLMHGEVLKIYKDFCRKDRLDLDTCKKLCGIKTKKILLPKKVIYDEEKKFCGYVTDYVQKYSNELINKMKMESFIKELEEFGNDLGILNDSNISVDDFNIGNTVYSSGLYLIDPGSYRFDSKDVKLYNNLIFNEYVRDDLLGNVKLTKKEKNRLRDVFPDDSYNICDVIKDEANSSESVRTFVKRVVK